MYHGIKPGLPRTKNVGTQWGKCNVEGPGIDPWTQLVWTSSLPG